MNDHIYKRIDQFLGLLVFGALFGSIALIANVEIKDLDLWLHLATGRFIVAHGYVPSYDVLSCTIQGMPWINHEWLFQVIVYYIHHVWGPDGLIKMQVVVVTVTMLFLLFLGYNRDRQLMSIIPLLLVYFVYQMRFTIRPDLYSLLFFTLYIFVLAMHIDKKWSLIFLFIVQVIWSNMHGFFFFGPLFVFIGLLSEWIKRRVPLPYEWNQSGRLTDDEFKRLGMIFIFSILACLINPQFVEGALYPIKVFFSLGSENKVFFDVIQELQKPISTANPFSSGEYMHYKLLIFLSAITFFLNRRRLDISALFFWLIFLIFSLKALRNLPFFAFAAYLVIITNMLQVQLKNVVPLKFSGKKFQYITISALKILILVYIVQYTMNIRSVTYYDFDIYGPKSEFGGVTQKGYPDKAADFLVENKARGNFFNDFNSGAYLLGRTFPDIKVFIDGRTEVYGSQFFNTYQKIWDRGDLDTLKEVINTYNLTGALLNSARSKIPKDVLRNFYALDDWHVVYFDYDAVVFLRDVPQNKEIIKKFAIDLDQWQVKKLDLVRIGTTPVRSYPNAYRAQVLSDLGLDEPALSEAEAALAISPDYSDPYEIIGKVYANQKKFELAYENFRKAVIFAPYSKNTRYNLALSLMDLGRYDAAVTEYKEIVKGWPGEAKGYFFLTKAYVEAKKYDQALENLKVALQMDSKALHDVFTIAQIFVDNNMYSMANRIYDLLLEYHPENADIHYRKGNVYLKMNEADQARTCFEKAVSLDPENADIRQALKSLDQVS